MVAPRPPLYRLSRAIRLVGILVLVAVLLYTAAAAVSAAELRPSDVGHGGTTTSVLANGTIEVAAAINLTNPGYFPINAISIAADVHLANGTRLGAGSSPPVAVAPGATARIPITFLLPLDFLGSESALLTHDAQLPGEYWVNVTYASLFTAEVEVANNLSWGAPFFGLNVTVGTPTGGSNGSLTFPAHVVFDNHARFGASGTLTFHFAAPGGATCGQGSVPVSDPAGAHVDQTVNVTTTCDPAGGTLYASFTGAPWTVAFPPEPIP